MESATEPRPQELQATDLCLSDDKWSPVRIAIQAMLRRRGLDPPANKEPPPKTTAGQLPGESHQAPDARRQKPDQSPHGTPRNSTSPHLPTRQLRNARIATFPSTRPTSAGRERLRANAGLSDPSEINQRSFGVRRVLTPLSHLFQARDSNAKDGKAASEPAALQSCRHFKSLLSLEFNLRTLQFIMNRLRLLNLSTIAAGALPGEPASNGGCGSYSMPS